MYQVLYRKWRPQVFSDVVGQEHITRTLMSAVEQNRVSHAYLFTGSRGTGKTSCAKILAKAVNCEHPVGGNPCNECASCKGIDNGSIVDVVEIDAASNNGVDNIRDLREETNYMPSQVKYRVFIIDEVHMLSTGAFNALLKTLEEPPEHVKFILATTEVHKLPATILSRCQRFDFKRISAEDICKRLKLVAEKENIELTDSGAMLIARVADGGMRDALSILDRCSSFGEKVDETLVAKASGIAGREHIFALTETIASHDTQGALNIVASLYQDSCDMERLMSSLIEHLRNIMICLSVKNASELILASESDIEKTKAQAQSFTVETVISCMDTVNAAITDMKKGAGKRITAEMAVIKLTTPALSTDNASILRRLSKLENGTVTVTKKASVETPKPIIKEEPKPEPNEETPVNKEPSVEAPPIPEETPEVNEEPSFESILNTQAPPEKKAEEVTEAEAVSEGVFKQWDKVKKIISQNNPILTSFISKSSAVVSGNVLQIKDANPILENFINQKEYYSLLENAVKSVSGNKYRITLFGKKAETEVKADVPEEESGLDAILKKAQQLNIQISEEQGDTL